LGDKRWQLQKPVEFKEVRTEAFCHMVLQSTKGTVCRETAGLKQSVGLRHLGMTTLWPPPAQSGKVAWRRRRFKDPEQ
jgi:hypothetical protein